MANRGIRQFTVEPWMAMILGGVLMVAVGAITINKAVAAINFDVLIFLVGMFALVGALDVAGVLQHAAIRLLSLAKTPNRLLLYVIVFTTVASAFLVNDAIVLVMTPMVIVACRSSHLRATPFLLAVAFSSNIGSALTPIGNPQNVLIKIAADLKVTWFMINMIPPVIAGTVAQYFLLKRWFRRHLSEGALDRLLLIPTTAIRDVSLMRKSYLVVGAVLLGFLFSDFLSVNISQIAIFGGVAILLLHNRRQEILAKIDWTIILFFSGLFVVVEGFAEAGVLAPLVQLFKPLFFTDNRFFSIFWIHVISTFVSQFTSNVPFVALFIPVFQSANAAPFQWLALAAGSTLGGNATLLGAAANVIVLEAAGARGETFSFREFASKGIILTVVTIVISIVSLTVTTALIPA